MLFLQGILVLFESRKYRDGDIYKKVSEKLHGTGFVKTPDVFTNGWKMKTTATGWFIVRRAPVVLIVLRFLCWKRKRKLLDLRGDVHRALMV